MYPIQPDPDSNDVIDMFLARGERWKRLRTIVNPTFSNAKMKQVRHIRKGSFISILRAIYIITNATEEFFISLIYTCISVLR